MRGTIMTGGLIIGIAAVAAGARADDADAPSYRLERQDSVGDVWRVRTLSLRESDVHYREPGRAAVGASQVRSDRNEYTEEVIEKRDDGSIVLRRHYDLSETLRKRAKSKETEPLKTALHGRDVTILLTKAGTMAAIQIEGVGAAQPDRSRVGPEAIAYGCLPSKPVAVRERWEIDPARLTRLLAGDGFDPALVKADSHGMLRGMKRHAGLECARIKIRVKLESEPTEVARGLIVDLQGELLFSPALGRALRLELKGRTGHVEKKLNRETGRVATTETLGTTHILFEATPK